jgi:hypothetical protein
MPQQPLPIDTMILNPASSVSEVLAKLVAIDSSISETDGVKWFNFLYLRVTQAVNNAAANSMFRDPLWINSLDVLFANLYFAAVSAAQTEGARIPPAWQPLFESRFQSGIAKLQYALVGMNAHINRDLPVALTQLAVDVEGYPSSSTDRYQDYLFVNGLPANVEEQVKGVFVDELSSNASLADRIANWNIEQARSAAWKNGLIMWNLRGEQALADIFLDTLDHTVGFAGRGLMIRI